jgi:hypothetical protein
VFEGTAKWAANYPTCGGTRQSPIDISIDNTVYDSTLEAFEFTNFNTINPGSSANQITWKLHNNGHAGGCSSSRE